jgi:hypothetical protein
MPSYAHQQKWKAHAIVPHGERFLGAPGNLGVNHGKRALTKINGYESKRDPDLWRRNCAPESVLGTKCGQGGVQALTVMQKARVLDVGYGFAGFSQTRVAE